MKPVPEKAASYAPYSYSAVFTPDFKASIPHISEFESQDLSLQFDILFTELSDKRKVVMEKGSNLKLF